MKHRTFSPNDWNILLTGALAWVLFALVAIILALLGIFWKPLVAALFFATFFAFITIVFRKGWYHTISLELAAIIVISFCTAYTWTQFTEPTIFSGRDQGSISEAAIRLAQNHKIPFSTAESQEFFKIYGPGKALNFPGFFYSSDGSLVTQFPLGYICWLATWFSILGIFGLIFANTLLSWFFLFFSYVLIRRFVSPLPAWLFFLLCSTSFLFIWFSRFTLSENMALPLLMVSVLSLHLFTQNPRRGTYIVWIASALTLALTRIEGFAIALVGLIIIFFYKGARRYIRKNSQNAFFIPIIISAIIITLAIYRDWAFYREIAKVAKGIIMPVINQTAVSEYSAWIENLHAWKILLAYSLASYIIVGLAAVAVAFIRGRFRLLLPFFIALPTFIYLADPHISADHPWMLRRYMFAIVPITMMYAVIGLTKLFHCGNFLLQKRLFQAASILFFLALFSGNIMTLAPYATFAENRNLLDQTKELSASFSSNDLVLVDRLATGDGWTMISDPMSSLLNKHAVYIFNITDLEKIDLKKFDKTYLIIPEEAKSVYLQKIGDKLKPVRNYYFATQRLDVPNYANNSSINLPGIKDIIINGTIYEYIKP